jgi:CRISPR-associated endonuclease/helicase Cas3
MFRTAAERFRLIDEQEGATVFVRYKRDPERRQHRHVAEHPEKGRPGPLAPAQAATLRRDHLPRDLQRLEAGDIEPLGGDLPGLYVQSANNDVLYDKVLGINVDGAPGDPGQVSSCETAFRQCILCKKFKLKEKR